MTKDMKRITPIIFVAILNSACASLFGIPDAKIRVTTEPPGAYVYVSGESEKGCTSPCMLKIDKPVALDRLTIMAEMPGHPLAAEEPTRKVAQAGYLNFCWATAVCCLAVDASTGNLFDYDENVNIRLLGPGNVAVSIPQPERKTSDQR